MMTNELLRVCDAPATASRGIDIITGYNKRFASVPMPKYVAHTAEADAERLVACWNALATIPDPAAFVQAARGMAEALEAMTTASQPQAVHRVYIGEAQDMADAALTAFRAATGGEA